MMIHMLIALPDQRSEKFTPKLKVACQWGNSREFSLSSVQNIDMSKEVTTLSADNRLVYKTLRCITKLTSLATSACHLLTRL